MDTTKFRVRDLMQEKVKTVTEKSTLSDTARMMRDLGVSSFIVEKKDEWDAFGIITRKDMVEALMSEPVHEGPLLVEDIMTKPAITVHPELSIYNCLQLMRMVSIRRMPVVEDNELIGIVSNTDLFKRLTEALG